MVDADETVPLRTMTLLDVDEVVLLQLRQVVLSEVPQRHGVVALLLVPN